MDPKILIPVDDSATSLRTIESIIAQRKRFPRTLTVLHVVSQDLLAYRMIPDFQLDMIRKTTRKAGNQLLEKYCGMLQEVGFACEKVLVTGDPRHKITEIANEKGFQLVVIGRHEGGGEIRDVLFGSVANHVLHNVQCPVLLF